MKQDDRVAAELALATLFPADDDAFALLAPALVRGAARFDRPPPLGVLADVAYLMLAPVMHLDEARRRLSALPVDDEALAAAVAAVFDAFVAPVARHPRAGAIRDALARHEPAIAVDAAGLLAAEVTRRVAGASSLPSAAPPAVIRRVLARPARDVARAGAAALTSGSATGPAGLRADLAAAYGAIGRAARVATGVLTDGDVLLAERAPALRSDATRLALRQLADAMTSVGRHVPRAIPARARAAGDVSTLEHEESTYPMGGFASVSTTGSLENVVSSELALSFPDADPIDDPFTVRWATGELLYYARDESVARRRATTLWIVFAADVALARVKDPSAPFQRSILGLATIAVFVERAVHILRDDALRVRVGFPPGDALLEERALAALVLGRGAAASCVELVEGTPAELDGRIALDAGHSALLRVDVRVNEAAPRGGPPAIALVLAAAPRVTDGRRAPGTSRTGDPFSAACTELLFSLP